MLLLALELFISSVGVNKLTKGRGEIPAPQPKKGFMSEEKANPKDQYYANILLAVPTFGMVSFEFMASQLTMALPIFTSLGYMSIEGKPVDVARNQIADYALNELKTGFVFFRDDDTIAPRDALIKLFKRLDPKQRALPGSLGDAIVGGTVYSKTQPPIPMIYREGITGGFEDWSNGDLVWADVIGMGCTMIPIGVFEKMMPFITFYQCPNENCPVRWYEDHKEPGNCKYCSQKLVPGWFKTVKDKDDSGRNVSFTEDSYFCLKARDAGIKTYCDCSVHTWHEDYATKTKYGYHPEIGPCWMQNGNIYYWPDAKSELHEQMELKPKSDNVKFNVGCGGKKLDGYVNIDMYVDADIRCDIKDITSVVRQYGQADEVLASHCLEHVDRDHVLKTVRGWLRAVKPGGKLIIIVPDLGWAIDNFKKQEEANNDKTYHHPETVIFGLQNHPGEYHKTGFTVRKLESIVKACENSIDSYTITENDAGSLIEDKAEFLKVIRNQKELILEIVKNARKDDDDNVHSDVVAES